MTNQRRTAVVGSNSFSGSDLTDLHLRTKINQKVALERRQSGNYTGTGPLRRLGGPTQGPEGSVAGSDWFGHRPWPVELAARYAPSCNFAGEVFDSSGAYPG